MANNKIYFNTPKGNMQVSAQHANIWSDHTITHEYLSGQDVRYLFETWDFDWDREGNEPTITYSNGHYILHGSFEISTTIKAGVHQPRYWAIKFKHSSNNNLTQMVYGDENGVFNVNGDNTTLYADEINLGITTRSLYRYDYGYWYHYLDIGDARGDLDLPSGISYWVFKSETDPIITSPVMDSKTWTNNVFKIYQTPGYYINGYRLLSVGNASKTDTSNQYTFNKVIRIPSTSKPNKKNPVKMNYTNLVPKLIFLTGTYNGKTYTGYSFSGNNVTITYSTDYASGLTTTYTLSENDVLVRYRRSNTNYIIDNNASNKLFVQPQYFFWYERITNTTSDPMMLGVLGINTSTANTIPVHFYFTMPLTTEKYNGHGGWSSTSESIYQTITTTSSWNQSYTNTTKTNGDYSSVWYARAIIGCSDGSTKPVTTYDVNMHGTVGHTIFETIDSSKISINVYDGAYVSSWNTTQVSQSKTWNHNITTQTYEERAISAKLNFRLYSNSGNKALFPQRIDLSDVLKEIRLKAAGSGGFPAYDMTSSSVVWTEYGSVYANNHGYIKWKWSGNNLLVDECTQYQDINNIWQNNYCFTTKIDCSNIYWQTNTIEYADALVIWTEDWNIAQ